MAIAQVPAGTIKNGSAVAATNFTTASITPGAGNVVIIGVFGVHASVDPSPTSITGASITGAVQINTQPFQTIVAPQRRVDLWVATGTGSAGALTISYGATSMTSCAWQVITFSGVDTAQGTQGVIQSVINGSNTAAATLTGTYAAFGNAANGAVAIVGQDASAGSVSSVSSGYTDAGLFSQSSTFLDAQYILPVSSTSFSTVSTNTARWGLVLAELAATVGVSLSISPAVVNVAAIAATVVTGGGYLPAVTVVARKPRRRFRVLHWFNVTAASTASSVAAAPATINVAAQATGVTPGAVSLAISPVTIPVTAVAPGIIPAVSLTSAPASVTVTAVALVRTAAASVASSPVSVAVTAVALVRTATASLAVTPAPVAVTAVALGTTVGGASVAIAPAAIPVLGVALGINGAGAATLPMSPAVVTVTAIAAVRTVGGISIAASPVTIPVVAVAPVLSPGVASLAAAPATIAVLAVALSRTGVTSVAISPAAITVLAVALVLATTGESEPGCLHATYRQTASIQAAVAATASITGSYAPTATIDAELEEC